VRFRKLRIAFSCTCGMACALLIAFWVRSYSDMEEWKGRLPGSFGYLFRSNEGRLTSCGFVLGPSDEKGLPNDWPVVIWKRPNRKGWVVQVPPWSKKGFLYPWGFRDTWTGSSWMVMLPYWFLVTASGLLAMAFQFGWSWQFSLRNLFVLTTFLAVVLGMVEWLDRAWIGR
jgi:hypothetical protein